MCDQVRMIQRIVWLSQMQLEEIKRLVESGENNVKANKMCKTEQALNL